MRSITTHDFGSALNLCLARSRTLLRGLPFRRTSRSVEHSFNLAHVLPILRPKYRRASAALLEASTADFSLYCDAGTAAGEALVDWINLDPVMASRLKLVRAQFFNALACMKSGSFYSDNEVLRVILPMSDYTLGFILTGSTKDLPTDWQAFAKGFACVHATAEFETVEFKPDHLIAA